MFKKKYIFFININILLLVLCYTILKIKYLLLSELNINGKKTIIYLITYTNLDIIFILLF